MTGVVGAALAVVGVGLVAFGMSRPHPFLSGDDLRRLEDAMGSFGPAVHPHEAKWVLPGVAAGALGLWLLVGR